MKNALIMIALLIAGQVSAQQALGEVIGEVTEGETSIPLVDARVYIEDGSRIYQAKTDIDGRFRISVRTGFPVITVFSTGKNACILGKPVQMVVAFFDSILLLNPAYPFPSQITVGI